MTTTGTKRFGIQKKPKNDEKKNKDLFAETLTVAPAPSRDYYALQLYQKKFLWTRWKISHGPCANPIQKTVSLDQFLKDITLQNELTYIFGSDTTNLIKDLANEKWSLISMPSNILQKIFSYITVPDILRMSQVCKRLSKECSKDELWRTISKKQWKILIHSDIEKANLIGWKKVYLEKMRPKRFKDPKSVKSNLLHRNHVNSVSSLKTPDSSISMTKSNFSIHKRVQELKTEAIRSSSEIFGRDFKAISVSTGKSTERATKTRCTSRNSDFRLFSSGKLNLTPRSNIEGKYFHKSSQSVANMVPLVENLIEGENTHKSKCPSKVKCRVINVRSSTAKPNQHSSLECERLKTDRSRPSTVKLLKAKQENKLNSTFKQ